MALQKKKKTRGYYKIKSFRISNTTYEKLKEQRNKSGLSWNLFFNKLTMGLLDPLPELPKQPKKYDDDKIELRCDRCGVSFEGEKWMLRTKKEVTCRNCWMDSQEPEGDYML